MEQGSFSRGDEKGTVSADAKTTSGLIKLIHPDGVCSREEMQEYLTLALELRRRVKEQLKRMGGHRFNVVGTSGKGIKESARMSYDYLKANALKMGIDRDISSYDTNIQVISLMQAKDAEDLGVVFFVGLVSALMGRPLVGGLVVLAT